MYTAHYVYIYIKMYTMHSIWLQVVYDIFNLTKRKYERKEKKRTAGYYRRPCV